MLKIFSAHLNAANVALIFNPFHIHNTTLAENEKNGKECFTARLFEQIFITFLLEQEVETYYKIRISTSHYNGIWES